jgi:hypothetical protein
MLGSVAEHHPENLGRCFDLLWQLGRDKPPGPLNSDQGHPISVIADVISYKHWKFLNVQDAALIWLERFFSNDDWQQHLHKPGWLFHKFFEPIFATSVEENWNTGRTLHTRSHLLDLAKTTSLRDRILALRRRLLARGDAHLASQLIPVLAHACDIARLGYGDSPPKEFNDKWTVERLKSLAVLEEMTRDFTEPFIQFQIRQSLMHYLHYGKGSPAFRDACRNVVSAIPDSLDLRIARTALSSY